MTDFNFEKLENLTSRVKVGFVGSINKFYCKPEGGVPLIRTTDISDINFDNLKFVTNEFHVKNKKSQLKKGDLIIARHGENGNAVIYKHDRDAQVLNAVIIEPDHHKISSDLLKIFFDSPFIKKQIKGSVKGSVQGVINTKHISDLLLNISDNINYEFVTNTIANISKNIELNNKINAGLEAMTKLIYDYWFVQFDFPDTSGKPYKSSGGKMVYNEALKREIPDGWEVKELGELIEFERGISYKSKEITGVGTPMINLNSFDLTGKYKSKGLKYFTGKYNENKIVSTNDLVIAITDVTRNADIIGKAFTIPDLFDNDILISCDVAKIVPSNLIDKQFLEPLFNSSHYHNYIKHFASGTLVLHLNLDGVKWCKIPLPPKELLNSYSKFRQSIDKKLTLAIKENQKLVELRNWLLPMLMNGQVTVNDSSASA